MDQEKFCDLGNLDEMDTSEIDLSSPPTSGEDYLRQVIVGRSKCRPIAVANREFADFTSKQTLQIPAEFLPHSSTCNTNSPPASWRHKQVSDFDRLRTQLSKKRNEILRTGVPKIKVPSAGNEEGWKKFCFETCSPQLSSSLNSCREENRGFLQAHNGTPPLLIVVASLSHAQAMDLFEFQVAWFAEDGYRRDRMHWLYALMLLIEKPLTPEVCSAARELARYFARLRRSVSIEQNGEDRDDILKACNLFQCLIVDYFGQQDLAEW